MKNPRAPKRHLPSSPFAAPVEPPVKVFAVGDRVTHDVHGLGRVTKVEESVAVLVDFDPEQKWIPSPYSRMHVL